MGMVSRKSAISIANDYWKPNSDLIGSERCCVVANHSTRLDWLLMLPLVLENDRLKELSWVFNLIRT